MGDIKWNASSYEEISMESSLDKEKLQYSQPLVGKIGTFVIQQDVNKVWVFCSLACIKLNRYSLRQLKQKTRLRRISPVTCFR